MEIRFFFHWKYISNLWPRSLANVYLFIYPFIMEYSFNSRLDRINIMCVYLLSFKRVLRLSFMNKISLFLTFFGHITRKLDPCVHKSKNLNHSILTWTFAIKWTLFACLITDSIILIQVIFICINLLPQSAATIAPSFSSLNLCNNVFLVNPKIIYNQTKHLAEEPNSPFSNYLSGVCIRQAGLVVT